MLLSVLMGALCVMHVMNQLLGHQLPPAFCLRRAQTHVEMCISFTSKDFRLNLQLLDLAVICFGSWDSSCIVYFLPSSSAARWIAGWIHWRRSLNLMIVEITISHLLPVFVQVCSWLLLLLQWENIFIYVTKALCLSRVCMTMHKCVY